MQVLKIDEGGYDAALIGNMLSFHTPDPQQPLEELVTSFDDDKKKEIAERLKDKDEGHNKFLQAIDTWWIIRAPRFWWSQFDTYRHAIQIVDESVSLSESTMHTLMRRPLTQHDFEDPVFGPHLEFINILIDDGEFRQAKGQVPEAFLQTRVIKLNYEVLRNVVRQRKNHKLEAEWGLFIAEILAQVDHEELLQ